MTITLTGSDPESSPLTFAIASAAGTATAMSVAHTRGAWLGYGAAIAVLLATVAFASNIFVAPASFFQNRYLTDVHDFSGGFSRVDQLEGTDLEADGELEADEEVELADLADALGEIPNLAAGTFKAARAERGERGAAMVMAHVGENGGLELDKDFYIEFPKGYRSHQIRLEGGDCSTDSFCYPSV